MASRFNPNPAFYTEGKDERGEEKAGKNNTKGQFVASHRTRLASASKSKRDRVAYSGEVEARVGELGRNESKFLGGCRGRDRLGRGAKTEGESGEGSEGEHRMS